MEKVVLNKVIEWLKNEVKENLPIVNSREDIADDEDFTMIGRHECAEGLLEMIAKWKEEEKNRHPKTMTMAELSAERRKNPEKYLSQYTIDEMKKLGLPIRKDNIPMDRYRYNSMGELIIKITDKEE